MVFLKDFFLKISADKNGKFNPHAKGLKATRHTIILRRMHSDMNDCFVLLLSLIYVVGAQSTVSMRWFNNAFSWMDKRIFTIYAQTLCYLDQ